MAVELRHLRYFAAVADARTVSLAATRLYLTQPVLSQALRQLEEVGVELLPRHARGVELTAAAPPAGNAGALERPIHRPVPARRPRAPRHG